jgi:hypothetical protein
MIGCRRFISVLIHLYRTKILGKGIIWRRELAQVLEGSNFGLICLTPENLSAPWLHFEAGALSKVAQSRVAPILFQLKTSDVQGPLHDFQLSTLANKKEMFGVLKSINDAMGVEANNVWERTFESLWNELENQIATLVIQDKIQITSPVSGGVLENALPYDEGFTYTVRGTLKLLPIDHDIFLLNSGSPREDSKQWPQRDVRYDKSTGEWEGRIYLQRWTKEVFINAVVAPPTSRQLFEYYRQYGGGGKPLTRIPVECENKAQIFARTPNPLPD